MHDFPSDAFGRDVSLKELSFWSQIDLQTLSGELKARIKEVNTKISRDEARSVYNKRLLNVRSYLECFRNKAVQELNNHYQDKTLVKARQEIFSLKKQLKDTDDEYRHLRIFMHNLQKALVRRFGAEELQEAVADAKGLTPNA